MGASIGPKQFGMPGLFGSSGNPGLVQQSQAPSPLQGPALTPISQYSAQPAQAIQQPVSPQAQPDPADLYQQDPIANRLGRYSGFYGQDLYY